eukprot:Rhum_TRINITY_DN14795_c12_g1::Rhum_TRINITY_DN14795_c12_g1_i1::g.118301::m.118301
MSQQYKNSFAKSVTALVESTADASEQVRDQQVSALIMLSQKDFGLVLDGIQRYLKEHNPKQTPVHQRITLLTAVRRVASKHEDAVSDDLMKTLVEVCYADMVAGVDVNNPWQVSACDTVAELMCVAPAVCVPFVAGHIPGTSLPNYFIMAAIGRAALQSPHRFLPQLKDCMARILPILGMAKQDGIRFIMADALSSMAEAILRVFSSSHAAAVAKETSAEEAALGGGSEQKSLDTPRSSLAKQYKLEDFNETMSTALTLLANDWAAAKDVKVRTCVALAVGRLAAVVSTDRLEERLPQLLKLLPAMVKKEKLKDAMQPLKGTTAFVRASMEKIPHLLLPQVEPVWQAAFAQVVGHTGLGPAEQLESQKILQEAMLCIEAMCVGSTETVLTFLQSILDVKNGSKDVTTRCAALGIIRHLVQTPHLDALLEPLKNNVVAIVKTCLEDQDYRMRKVIVNTIMTMGASTGNLYLACEGAESLVLYVVVAASTPPHVSKEWAVKNKKLADSGSYPTPDEVKNLSLSVLQLFHTQFAHLDTVLWPLVLEVVGQMPKKPELYYSFSTLCGVIIAVSQRLGNTHDFYFDFDKKVNVPKPEALIPLFCVMASQPAHLGIEATDTILRAMECVSPLLDEPMKKGYTGQTPLGSLWLGLLPEMRGYLASAEFKQEDYEEACHNLLKKSCTAKKEESWVQAIGTQMGEQLPLFAPADVPKDAEGRSRQDHKRVALSMFGLCLSKANLKSFVVDNLHLLADATDHTEEVQRQGCARAFGAAAGAHCDQVLEKLNRVAKPKAGGGGGGGLFGKKADTKSDPDAKDYGELARATVLLSFGHVAKKANHKIFSSRLETHVVPTLLEVLQANPGKNPVVRLAALAGLSLLGKAVKASDSAYTFASKLPVITHIISLMNVDPTQYAAQNDVVSQHLLYQGMGALTSLLYLSPANDRECLDTVTCCISAAISKEWKPPGEKDPKKKEDPATKFFQLLPEKEMQKQLGALCSAVLENSGDSVVTSMVSQGALLAEFMREEHPVRRERATKAYVVILKHFGKTCDARGVTVPICKLSPASEERADEPNSAPVAPAFLKPVALGKDGKVPVPKAGDPSGLSETQRGLLSVYQTSILKKPANDKDAKRGSTTVDGKEAAKAATAAASDLSLGTVIGRLLPRLSDGSLKTKTDALDGVSFSVKLSLLAADQHGQPNKVALDQYEKAIGMLKEISKKGLDYQEEAEVVVVMKDVTQALCLFMRNTRELPNLLDELIRAGLLDPVEDASVGVCCILSGFFKTLSAAEENLSDEEVKLLLRKMVDVLVILDRAEKALPQAARKDTKRGTLLAIKALAKNRPAVIFNEIGLYPVPHTEVITSVVQTIANDTGLATLFCNHSLDVMLNSQLYNETYSSGCTDKGDKLSLSHLVVASGVSIGEVCMTTKGSDVARGLRAPLLGALLLVLSAAHEAPHPPPLDDASGDAKDAKGKKAPPKAKKAKGDAAAEAAAHVPPAALIVTAVQSLVGVVFPGAYERCVPEFWEGYLVGDRFAAGTAMLLLGIVHECHKKGDKDTGNKTKLLTFTDNSLDPFTATMVLPPTTSTSVVQELFDFIVQYISKVYDSQRRAALVILGQLLFHCLNDQELFKGIINALLSRSGQDEQLVIKLQATRAFLHLPEHSYDGIKLYVSPVISSLVGCCGDPHSEVVLSAMRTLESLMLRMRCKDEVSAVTVNICLKTKSAIDNADPRIRAAACSLFRVLCDLSVAQVIERSTLDPNVYTHLPGLLCHVNDDDEAVRRSAKACLHAIVPFVAVEPPTKKAADSMRRLFELDHLQVEASTKFEDFAHDFSRMFMKHFSHRSNDLLVACIAYYQSGFPFVRSAAALFTGFLLKFLADTDQARSNLESATSGLIQLVKKDTSVDVRVRASKAVGHLGDMA